MSRDHIDEEQQRLQRAAAHYFAAFDGADDKRSENVREAVRRRLQQNRAQSTRMSRLDPAQTSRGLTQPALGPNLGAWKYISPQSRKPSFLKSPTTPVLMPSIW